MDLGDWRSRIDNLDNQILLLLNQRAEAALNVTLDRLIDSDVVICGELYLDVAQYLLSHAPDLSQVKRVLSHPQGLAQCRQWLAQNLPNVPTEEFRSTAGAVEVAAAER